VAVDFAVLARFPDANAAANHALGDLKAFFIMGIRGLGTWGAAWYLDWRSMDLANRLPPKEDVTYQALLKVEYWDYRVREVTDVSEENQAFFDREMAPETIQKTLEEHCVRTRSWPTQVGERLVAPRAGETADNGYIEGARLLPQ
jgi:hypothetical protein